ncbi:hypothetical protein EI545_08225 [Tabrizicola piscis]|uniref:DUF6473 domain-containing protein n=1 Tax=Tabrizicola piscis TaxID=2494374 RepID=A0A3S8U5F9_9RHOB|nr:DUF6473 family protein [Tabrizicola piscis]AZL58827.1 hypothetical protein EI545_08225 [Tabrizicola piscis]
MMPVQAGAGALDYFPCRYGASRALFRGPERDLSGAYIVALGGSPTFGKYVARPYPVLLERAVGQPVANLGGLNAGPDFYLSDPAALRVASRAQVAILQVTGADGLSNPFYTVHARRNDRFLAATPALRALYPEVDFAEIHFTRHLLSVLARTDAARFDQLRAGLQANWLCRMRQLMAHLPIRRVLLWLANAPPPQRSEDLDPGLGPLLVTADMLAALCPVSTALVVAVPSPFARAEGPARMHVPLTEVEQARHLPGSAAHHEVAALLGPVIARML